MCLQTAVYKNTIQSIRFYDDFGLYVRRNNTQEYRFKPRKYYKKFTHVVSVKIMFFLHIRLKQKWTQKRPVENRVWKTFPVLGRYIKTFRLKHNAAASIKTPILYGKSNFIKRVCGIFENKSYINPLTRCVGT